MKPYPYPRACRLQGKKQFGLVFQKGVQLRNQHMNLYFYPVPEGPVRTGVVVSTATGDSVRRNRVKRHLRELIRNHPALLPPVPGYLVLQFKQRIEPSYDALHADYLLGLKRMKACLKV